MVKNKYFIVMLPLIMGFMLAVDTASAQQRGLRTEDKPVVIPTRVSMLNDSPVSTASSLSITLSGVSDSATVNTLPSVFHLDGITPILQGLNDCGPANITLALQFNGWTGTQDQAVAALKPNPNDLNVSAWELVRFVNEQTPFRAFSRVGGTLPLLKQLVVAKFAVILETGYLAAGDGWTQGARRDQAAAQRAGWIDGP